MRIERVSIELTNRCRKACDFCYNASDHDGRTHWAVDEVVHFVSDLARHGTEAVSFGGGEPTEFPQLDELMLRTRDLVFRSLTTHGLGLDDAMLDRFERFSPDKVHVSIHFPGHLGEVKRVGGQVHALAARGIKSGVNLLVRRSALAEAAHAAAYLQSTGIDNSRIVYLPMRGSDTPTPGEVSEVAGRLPFQSMTCLETCAPSRRFCAVDWAKRAAFCSYTTSRVPLAEPSHAALRAALDGLDLRFCGNLLPLRSREMR